ncbi:hypothetical protein CRENBAI_007168 [Crenichthys baileyi]|uniref:Uncharacterized protein n=1 Tax=Crenichthys baileyi TaxID=28760 RepID=A0AAV9RMP2_9TELE
MPRTEAGRQQATGVAGPRQKRHRARRRALSLPTQPHHHLSPQWSRASTNPRLQDPCTKQGRAPPEPLIYQADTSSPQQSEPRGIKIGRAHSPQNLLLNSVQAAIHHPSPACPFNLPDSGETIPTDLILTTATRHTHLLAFVSLLIPL